MNIPDNSTKLSNLQLELLKIFSRELPEEELLEIKHLLSAYFAEKATRELDNLWDKNQWSQQTMQDWLTEHMRTPYKK